jgi:hypothetical protein
MERFTLVVNENEGILRGDIPSSELKSDTNP